MFNMILCFINSFMCIYLLIQTLQSEQKHTIHEIIWNERDPLEIERPNNSLESLFADF